MFRRGVGGSRSSDELVLGDGCDRDCVGQGRLAERQRPGLVEDDHLNLRGRLERGCVLEEDALARTFSDADGDSRGRRERERVGAGDHDRRYRRRQREQHAGTQEVPYQERRDACPDRDVHEVLSRHIGERLRRRLGRLRLLHHRDDARERGICSDGLGAERECSALVHGAADHLLACGLVHRRRFSRDHRLIHVTVAAGDGAVHRDARSWADDDLIANLDVFERDFGVVSVAPHDCRRGCEFQQRFDGLAGGIAAPHLHPVAQQRKCRQGRRGIVEHVAGEEERGPDRIRVADDDAQSDQRHHVRFAP